MDVNCLPDEVMTAVFALLPPVMLLDVIPLVCKRWHELSRELDAWKNVNLIMPLRHDLQKQWKDLARLAKAAPYLNCIDLSKINLLDNNVELITNALVKERKVVKTFKTLNLVCGDRRMLEISENMLEKFAFSLQEVVLILSNTYPVTEEFHGRMNSLLTLVSKMPRLQTLGFYFHYSIKLENYGGQLGKGCKSLQKIVVWGAAQVSNFVLDVIISKKDSLQEISYYSLIHHAHAFGLYKDFYTAVMACKNVQTCEIPIEILPIVTNMIHLRSLKLLFPFKIDGQPALDPGNLRKFIEESCVIENIAELTLVFRFDTSDEQILLAEMIVKKIREIKVFHINGNDGNEHLLSIFFPNIKYAHTISFHRCQISGKHIDIIMKDLRKLIFLKITGDQIPRLSDKDEFEVAVRRLQSSQPQLAVVIDKDDYVHNGFDTALWMIGYYSVNFMTEIKTYNYNVSDGV